MPTSESDPDVRPSRPRLLTRDDVREGFTSGAEELDVWLLKYAWQNLRANSASTYVTVAAGRVVGYYAISVAGVSQDEVPASVAKHSPRQVPCILLARLAVDQEWIGRRIGKALVLDALHRAVQVSETAGVMAVLIHARDDTARAFYQRIGEFVESPAHPLQLMMPIKVVRKALETGATGE